MCGISGIAHSDPRHQFDEVTIQRMRESLVHRGPDDAGSNVAPGVALASRRLAILDLSGDGHMPMTTFDGRYTITYNGEVYNFAELRERLVSRGYSFRSNGDTEVVLNLYADEGPAMLERLNGMFAIAIWDSHERTLFLARDRMGVKPLYYAIQNRALYFASEEKALFAAGIPADFDQPTLEELLCFRYVAGERTPFLNVKRLLPGHFMIWKNGAARTHRWWSLQERVQSIREALPIDPVGWFREAFNYSVGMRLISDVPVGILLSGGLDSSSIASSVAQQTDFGLSSFTVRFPEADYDEGPLARQVAASCGLNSHELTVAPNEIMGRLSRASWLNDEPLVHGNDLHLGALSEYAKSRVTVLLSGEGADEILGGYVRYQPLRYPAVMNSARHFFPGIRAALNANGRFAKLSRFLELGSLDRFVFYNACDVLPDDLSSIGFEPTQQFPYREKVLKEAKDTYPNEPVRQAMYSDHHTFLCSILDRNDRMTMGASIECRVPFLDYRIVEGLASLPTNSLLGGRKNKPILRKAFGPQLPAAILKHRKWGFGVPWGKYFREVPELRSVLESLPEMSPLSDGPFDRRKLKGMIARLLQGESSHELLVRQLLMIAIWHQECVTRAPMRLGAAV